MTHHLFTDARTYFGLGWVFTRMYQQKKYTWAIDESLPHKDTRITIQLKHQHKVLQKKLLAFTEKSNYSETTES